MWKISLKLEYRTKQNKTNQIWKLEYENNIDKNLS